MSSLTAVYRLHLREICSPLLLLQGIQFLLENDLLQQTPDDIAQFLYKGEGLNKTVIGDYLGERWDGEKKTHLHELNATK